MNVESKRNSRTDEAVEKTWARPGQHSLEHDGN